jgi:hypothetical protein
MAAGARERRARAREPETPTTPKTRRVATKYARDDAERNDSFEF